MQHQSKKYDCKTQGYRLDSVRDSDKVIGIWNQATATDFLANPSLGFPSATQPLLSPDKAVTHLT